MHKPEFVLETEMHKILLDLEIPFIPDRRPELVVTKKRRKKRKENLPYSEICRPRGP